MLREDFMKKYGISQEDMDDYDGVIVAEKEEEDSQEGKKKNQNNITIGRVEEVESHLQPIQPCKNISDSRLFEEMKEPIKKIETSVSDILTFLMTRETKVSKTTNDHLVDDLLKFWLQFTLNDWEKTCINLDRIVMFGEFFAAKKFSHREEVTHYARTLGEKCIKHSRETPRFVFQTTKEAYVKYGEILRNLK
jgi:hypothetical protein